MLTWRRHAEAFTKPRFTANDDDDLFSMICVVSSRAQLQKEKQLRESAEQQRQELEERIKKYQEEVERARKKKKKKKKKLYSTPNRQMYKLQYLTYQIYNLSNYVRTYIDIMCINIHRRYKKMININNVLWGR